MLVNFCFVDLMVDVGDSYPILEHPILCFDYESLGTAKTFFKRRIENVCYKNVPP